MKNIFRIYTTDIKKLVRNPFALVIAIGLCLLPSLYAWFNIYSNWDPYGNTSNLKIAVATEDVGYTKEEGYLPISLQYRPYTSTLAREVSIAGGDPLEDSNNRTYRGKTSYTSNESDLGIILETKEAMGDKPVIVSINMTNPTVVGEFENKVDSILADFGSQTQSIMDIICGKFNPSGLLPFNIPLNMEAVEKQLEDVPHDIDVYVDEENHGYCFSYGMNFDGVINDERVKKYKHN